MKRSELLRPNASSSIRRVPAGSIMPDTASGTSASRPPAKRRRGKEAVVGEPPQHRPSDAGADAGCRAEIRMGAISQRLVGRRSDRHRLEHLRSSPRASGPRCASLAMSA